jgi:hypothetical protein
MNTWMLLVWEGGEKLSAELFLQTHCDLRRGH